MAHHIHTYVRTCTYSIWSITNACTVYGQLHTYIRTYIQQYVYMYSIQYIHMPITYEYSLSHMYSQQYDHMYSTQYIQSHIYIQYMVCSHTYVQYSTEWSHIRTKNHQSIVSASQLTIDGGQREFGFCVMCCHGNNMVVRHCSCFKVIQTVQALGMLQPDPSLWAWEQIIE